MSQKNNKKTYSPGDPNFDAFKFGPTAQPLTPMVFHGDCVCGQRIFTVSGFGMAIDVPIGMDLVCRCKCGREYSANLQSAAALEKLKAQQAGQAPAEGQPPVDSAPAAPAEAPVDPQAANKTM
jgi:hypothetical protein